MQKQSKSLALIGRPVNLNEREGLIYQSIVEDQGEDGFNSDRTSHRTHEIISELSRDKMVRKNKFDIKKSAPILESVDFDIDASYSTMTRKSYASKSPSEKSSFGTKNIRFPSLKESLLSPASYDVRKQKNSLDFNAKGYGGLVSKKERFGHLPYLNSGPGPGQYSPSSIFKPGPNIYHAFLPPKFPRSPKVIPMVNHYKSPGPGSYKLNENLTKKSISNYASVFKSSSQRGIMLL